MALHSAVLMMILSNFIIFKVKTVFHIQPQKKESPPPQSETDIIKIDKAAAEPCST